MSQNDPPLSEGDALDTWALTDYGVLSSRVVTLSPPNLAPSNHLRSRSSTDFLVFQPRSSLRDMSALSLPDHIELVSSISKSIRTNASELDDSAPGFFTNAVLRTPLADLIREADPSEVGLFTLVPPSSYGVGAEEEVEPGSTTHVTRVDLPSATPLRPRTGREIKTQDHEPEVYANAALKFLDR